jgi:hypothetical protein
MQQQSMNDEAVEELLATDAEHYMWQHYMWLPSHLILYHEHMIML